MAYFTAVLDQLLENNNDTVFATRAKWGPTRQVRVMWGKLYGQHLAIFDLVSMRAQPYSPSAHDMAETDWTIQFGEKQSELVENVILNRKKTKREYEREEAMQEKKEE